VRLGEPDLASVVRHIARNAADARKNLVPLIGAIDAGARHPPHSGPLPLSDWPENE